MSAVLNAPALLAFLNGEPTAERVEARMAEGAVMAAVMGEAVAKLTERVLTTDRAWDDVAHIPRLIVEQVR